MFFSIAVIGIVTLFLIYLYLTRNFSFFKKRGVPGPRPLPILGTLGALLREGVVKHDENLKKMYGKNVGTFFGNVPNLVTFDIDLIKEVLITNNTSFQDHYVPYERKPPLRKFVSKLHGDEWRRVRNAITPIFTSGKLKRMVPMIYSSVEHLSEKFIEQADTGKDVDIKALFGRYTITVIADTMFGMKITALDDPEDQFYIMSKKVMSMKPRAMFMLFLMIVPSIGKLLSFFNIEAFDYEAIGFITKGLERALNERKGREDEYNDFVSLLLKAEIPEEDARSGVGGLTTEEMISQALMFMMAGYDTTATSLTMTAYNLALHPEQQERCREEVLAEFQDESPPEPLNVGIQGITGLKQPIVLKIEKI